jgi:epoxyqueuosine reductase QueG
MTTTITKKQIKDFTLDLGAAEVGFAPVARWEEQKNLPPDFFPHAIFSWAKTVVVALIPSLLPTVETKFAHVFRSQYHNTNSLLDEIAYRLAAYLNRQGQAAVNISRDGYGLGTLAKKPYAAFSHVWAGHYAGLGTVGWNHTLVTKRFGPRHRLVSVITAWEVEGDPMLDKELCTRCRICEKICPGRSFSGAAGDKYPEMDRFNCTSRRKNLPYPHCGFCIKSCPIGDDRKLYASPTVKKYFAEVSDLAQWQSGIGGQLPLI